MQRVGAPSGPAASARLPGDDAQAANDGRHCAHASHTGTRARHSAIGSAISARARARAPAGAAQRASGSRCTHVHGRPLHACRGVMPWPCAASSAWRASGRARWSARAAAPRRRRPRRRSAAHSSRSGAPARPPGARARGTRWARRPRAACAPAAPPRSAASPPSAAGPAAGRVLGCGWGRSLQNSTEVGAAPGR